MDPADPYDADFVNVIGQSFAARALTTAGSSRAAAATAFLLDQQCNDGFFRATLTGDKEADDQGCVDGVHSASIDTTALAVINILDSPGASTASKGAAALAATWLKGQQAADGSFTAGGDEGYNSNSTGLAGWALAEAGHDAAATKAASWLRGLQVADLAPCAAALAADNGAVLLKTKEVAAVRTAGSMDVPTRERSRRATAQALPALVNVPTGGAVSLSAPATAVEKSTVTITVTGLGAGEPACVSLGGQAKSVTGTGAALNVSFQLPAGVATHTFRLTTLGGSMAAATSATATPAPAPAPVPRVGALDTKRVVKVRRNRFAVSVACEGATACAGTLKVRTARKVEMRSGKRVVAVARREYSVAAGEEKRLVMRLTKAGRLAADRRQSEGEGSPEGSGRGARSHDVLAEACSGLIRMTVSRMRSLAHRLALTVLGGGAVLVASAAVAPAADAATCTSAGGVSVVVDYRELGGAIFTACATDGGGKSAAEVVASVGVTITYATRQPGFVCRVQGQPAADPCVNASPANAYWGLWGADGSKASWTYSSSGIGGLTVPAGGSVGLSWQQDRENSGAVPPGVAPPVAPAPASPSPSPTASPTSSPTSSSPTSSPGSSPTGSSPTATPSSGGGSQSSSPSPGAGGGTSGSGGTSSPSASPSGSPSTPSESPLASGSPGDSRASGGSGGGSGKGSDDPTVDDESPGDSTASEDAEATDPDGESPSDASASAHPEAGQPTADEPGRIPAALTWSIFGLLAIAIAGSAVVARRRRGV